MRITLDGESFELSPDLVRARIADQAPEDIRQYWVEIDGRRWPVKQVISLATGVHDRQRFLSQSARRWLQRLGFTIGRGQGLERVAPAVGGADQTAKPGTGTVLTMSRAADVVLVGCVKTKVGHAAAAKDLYASDYFAKMRAYAEGTGLPWFILSAEHGLVGPEEWLEPYERYLPDTSRDYRRTWGEGVGATLERAVGPLAGKVIDVHAGAAYVGAIRDPLENRGAQVLDQLEGLSFGRRLSWYLHQEGGLGADARLLISRLQHEETAMTPSDIIATGGVNLRAPGMYSWWVDAAGAEELGAGLGHQVEPGMIYAGLAGSTRSGGKASSNTLWGRIATMHLGKKHQFSTFRLSVGSILAEAQSLPGIDEEKLTRWMLARLRVIAIPVADADSLDVLESEVLAELDPPLNLAKVPKTEARRRLSALRKKYSD